MASLFRPTSIADLSVLRASLKRFFDMPDGMPFIDPAHMEWKYYVPHPHWVGSRSYVIDRGGEIVAHGAAWPFHLLADGRAIPGFHLIDWGADEAVPGAGISVLRKMLKFTDLVCSFGGSPATQAILPTFGFKPANTMQVFARPLRPLRQMLSHPLRNYHLPARAVRNLMWRYLPSIGQPRGWRAELCEPKSRAALFPVEVPDRLICSRSVELFDYLNACRSASFRMFTVFKEEVAVGYFVLSDVPWHVRIADIWITSQTTHDYTNAYMLAAATALEVSPATEMVAASAWPVAQRAMQHAGFRLRESTPVMIYSPSGALSADRLFDFQMIDSDAAFLRQLSAAYKT